MLLRGRDKRTFQLAYRKTHQKWCVFCCSAEFMNSLQKKLTKQYGYDIV
ncbi:hypothetical protein RUMCAL_01651 [Ruminococcus callidus ATCC 27760]|uniref:Uncharacterized protein n=1 Tax=Ruminococcus callidus ATCC 27760 TaxID=411473 RepID=U2KT29_9FIRM|nr:hypothetical protein RUMCAL_01651 [Ruminococcus callidus ATCC 27760]